MIQIDNNDETHVRNGKPKKWNQYEAILVPKDTTGFGMYSLVINIAVENGPCLII